MKKKEKKEEEIEETVVRTGKIKFLLWLVFSDFTIQNEHLSGLVQRLQVELHFYQTRFPSTQIPEDVVSQEDVASTNPLPPWIARAEFMSPLISAYDNKIGELEAENERWRDKFEEMQQSVQDLIQGSHLFVIYLSFVICHHYLKKKWNLTILGMPFCLFFLPEKEEVESKLEHYMQKLLHQVLSAIFYELIFFVLIGCHKCRYRVEMGQIFPLMKKFLSSMKKWNFMHKKIMHLLKLIEL